MLYAIAMGQIIINKQKVINETQVTDPADGGVFAVAVKHVLIVNVVQVRLFFINL